MRFATFTAVVALTLSMPAPSGGQAAPRVLVAVFAHADDEVSVGPVLARYAREGVQVHVIVATDGAQGGRYTSIPRGPELARVRSEEMQCATKALGTQPPVQLGFPDGELGHYAADPSRLVQLGMRLHAELQRLRPDALITWGADGGPPHPDHKLVSDVVTQLVRAGAPGVPERLFYAYLPAEGMRVMNPARGAPPFAVPLAKYFTVHMRSRRPISKPRDGRWRATAPSTATRSCSGSPKPRGRSGTASFRSCRCCRRRRGTIFSRPGSRR